VTLFQKKEDSIEEIKKKHEKGLVFVYTGNGKGKTTAALGLALRAIGHGRKVLMIQFMKGRDYGETLAVERFLPDLTLYKCGQDSFVMKGNLSPLDIELALKGLQLAREAMLAEKYDLIILDEINVAVNFNLVPLEDILDLIRNKPEKIDLGLTGRYAPPEVIALADLVTEMKEIKHPFSQGISAREGFEF
jgi:cob(I)alamin adenosyltransferase